MTVSGFVPGAADRATLHEAAVAVSGEREPVIETTQADGAPSGFVSAGTFAIGLLDKLDEGAAVISGTHIALSGVAASPGDLIELNAAVANPPSGYDISSAVTPPVVIPYVWAVTKDADQLTISGSVPTEAIRSAIGAVTDAMSEDLGVIDRTGLGAGLDPAIDLVAVARKALALLGNLDEGEVRFVESVISVTGKAADPGAAAAIDRELADLPAGVVKGGVSIDSGSTYRFFIERGFDTVTLDGQLSDEGMRGVLRKAAEAAFGKADILDSMAVAKSVPPDARDAALLAIRAASLLAKGNVSVEGNVISVRGSAFTGIGATRLPSELSAAVPAGYKLELGIDALPPEPPLAAEACVAAIDEVLKRAPVHFDQGAATVAVESRGLLDRLGALSLRCPAARLSLSATVTSANGGEALAKSRAGTVAAALVDVGVDPGRLVATGTVGSSDALSVTLAPAN